MLPTTNVLVLDTNIVLDLLVYTDPKAVALQATLVKTLQSGEVIWMATHAMREELARVLTYPQLTLRLATLALNPETVLARMDERVRWAEVAPKAPYTCTDAEDQMFIDLACHLAQNRCRVVLLSKDKAVLAMRSRLARLGAVVTADYTRLHDRHIA